MPSRTVLVVDDSPTAQRIIRVAVESGGYRVLSASDGDEAIEVATREIPDLIVLDIILPKKNGFQVCRHMRDQSRLTEQQEPRNGHPLGQATRC